MEWIHLAQDSGLWLAFVNMVTNVQVQYNVGIC